MATRSEPLDDEQSRVEGIFKAAEELADAVRNFEEWDRVGNLGGVLRARRRMSGALDAYDAARKS